MKSSIYLSLTLVMLLLGSMLPLTAAGQENFDSLFIAQSRPVIFQVNSDYLRAEDERWIADTLRHELEAIGPDGIIICRSAASPEGPYYINERLAHRRRDAMLAALMGHGYDPSHLRFDVVPEDYTMLSVMMHTDHDPEAHVVKRILEHHDAITEHEAVKEALMTYEGGRLWKRLLAEYFPRLRSVRILAIDSKRIEPARFSQMERIEAVRVTPGNLLWRINEAGTDIHPFPTYNVHRIPLLNVRTNLAYDIFYMPDFGWAPMWNVGLEYYPRRGHFTYSAWFMEPYYQRWSQHKFFQIRNYELETRFYFRGTDRADYHGFYLSAAIDANKFGIGLGPKKGWEGEGFGAQLNLGYVLPLARYNQWKLQFAIGGGFYQAKYDPYVYGVPEYFGPHESDDKYYYDTNLYGDEFKKRQHRYRWLGPTQVAINLSYDLLWRKGTDRDKTRGGGKTHGASFRPWEKKGGDR